MLAVCGGLLSFRRLTQVLGAHHLRPRAEAHLEKGPTTPSTRQLFCCGKYFLGSLCKMQYSHATSLLRQELEKVRTGKKLEKLSCKESYLDILCDLTIQLALVLLLYIYFKLWHRCAPKTCFVLVRSFDISLCRKLFKQVSFTQKDSVR